MSYVYSPLASSFLCFCVVSSWDFPSTSDGRTDPSRLLCRRRAYSLGRQRIAFAGEYLSAASFLGICA